MITLIKKDHHEYHVVVNWNGDTGGTANTRGLTLTLDMPEAFGGVGQSFCPDELFLSSIGGCLLTTFIYFRNKYHFDFKKFNVDVHGDVGTVGPEGYRVTRVVVSIRVETDEAQRDAVKKYVEMAKHFCHITRSLEKSIPIEVGVQIIC